MAKPSQMSQSEIEAELKNYTLEGELLSLKRRREKILEFGLEITDRDKHQKNIELQELNERIDVLETRIYVKNGGSIVGSVKVTIDE